MCVWFQVWSLCIAWTIWDLSLEEQFPIFQQSLAVCSSLSRGQNSNMAPFLVIKSIGIGFVIVWVFRQPFCWGIMAVPSLLCIGDTVSQHTAWSFWSLSFSIPSSMMYPELGCKSYVSIELGFPWSNDLWIITVFLMVYVCYKEKLFWCGVRAILNFEYMDNL